jgi:hypothetical protein
MWVIALGALVGAVLGSMALAVHRFRVATRDSFDLATKLSAPDARRVRDWPELRLDAVVIDPDAGNRVLVSVHWPAHPERQALLTIDVTESLGGAHRLLHQWRDIGASVSPRACGADALVLRRRRSNDTVRVHVVSEAPATIPL